MPAKSPKVKPENPEPDQGLNVCYTSASQDEVRSLVIDHHYSGRMPSNVQAVYCAREAGGLFGDFGNKVFAAAIFSIPPTRWGEDVLELSRLIRLPDYNIPLSQLISFACKQLKKRGFGLLVSFADQTHNHHGGIYRACSWNYAGYREPRIDGLVLDGKFIPGRSANSRFGTRSASKLQEAKIDAEPHYDGGKHLYWKALTVWGKTRAKRLGLENVTRPVDELLPRSVSQAQPLGVTP